MPRAATRRFDGRVAVVTGASRGIGRATALQLAEEGAAVVVNARRREKLDDLVTEIGNAGGRSVAVAGDIIDPDLPSRLIGAAVTEFDRIDVIVNNAAISKHYGPLLEAEQAAFSATVLGNCWPQLAIVQEAVKRGFGTLDPGSVVNVSSIGPHNRNPWTAPYNAGKAALERVTDVLAIELGPRGIRINVVAPGLVKTDLSRVFWDGELGGLEAAELPLRRIGAPQDIAEAVCFLASDDASWITGALLVVDGGRMLLGGEPLKESSDPE